MSATKLNQKNNQSRLSTDMLRAYLHEIGQIPLLDHSEEITYGRQVQRMMSLLTEKEKLEQQRGCSIGQLEWANPAFLTNTAIAINRSLTKSRFDPDVCSITSNNSLLFEFQSVSKLIKV